MSYLAFPYEGLEYWTAVPPQPSESHAAQFLSSGRSTLLQQKAGRNMFFHGLSSHEFALRLSRFGISPSDAKDAYVSQDLSNFLTRT